MSRKKKAKKKSRARRKSSSKNRPRCGLCGKTGNLTRTECCGQLICDDEDQYVMFSYARNSCSRNHDRYTLCGFHYNEGHSGHWKDCPECRKAFETEMYVYYGTNGYNFEKLKNPPEYESTKCSQCDKVIALGEDGYMVKGGEYWCSKCSAADLPDFITPS